MQKIIEYGLSVVLVWNSVVGVALGQVIEWERSYSQVDTVEGSGTYYSGRHILPMSDGGYVVTSITGGGGTVAVARFDGEGMRMWERGVTDNDSNIYGSLSFGEQVKIYPRFSYEREDGRVVMFGNEGGSFFSSLGYGSVYQLVLNEMTGEPLDTLAGLVDTATSLVNGSATCRLRDGRFVSGWAWQYSQNLDSLGWYCPNLNSSPLLS